ncbi:beta-ketoacyl-[acyl-carrier-protein] synthase family protein [Marixanthomonas sp. SCSIO 43207]|uniref:beta-ketoacyl-[acyl-carrier-protein] synthase family protein n=1 Tax=Marixanthomonas sp. SCSIO 43207 TaxID=2779360 RepID=UPI001CA9F40A|nr:beta-ketoacyl-[acyl-carrier-protein] synthase family protein [Marixanthomonas sp. SCSIO 43207]UAB81692.1 beta-ketoacyl-[acyl-carrier-protein] synthase family protein [Marixanthomonas sp. SCSIO 43207]
MNNEVAITGMGILSAIGNSVQENRRALLSSKSGLGTLKHIDSNHKNAIKVGEVSLTNSEIVKRLNLSEKNNFTRTALLGTLAAKEAMQQAKVSNYSDYKTGFISATTVGGMDMTENHWNQFASNSEVQKYISSHNAGDSTEKIADYFGITDYVTTISTACSSAANAIMLGARLLKAGKLDRVIVGGTDALSKFTINGFKSLMILSESNCKPFDANRSGLNLGEAAAYLVLESNKVVAEQNKKVLAYVSGYGNANDAFHQTASSKTGEGAFLAMEKALKTATLNATQISYINAHGTATQNNDLSESVALQRVFKEMIPSFSSTKPFTGHTLAAAGAVEAILSIIAIQENKVFANLGFQNQMPETGLYPVTQLENKEINHVLSNSFGFGGNCTSLIFSRP